ncbi:MAG: 4Fe-4S dicluster domain-containing protein [Bacteroidota bacterium]
MRRTDERDIVFSRRRLEEGSERYREYYSRHPEREEIDRHFRNAAGLLSATASFSHPLMFPAADATFDTVEALHNAVAGEITLPRTEIEASVLTSFLKGWLLQLGAHSVGVTELLDEHCYSHAGRGEDYGREIVRTHRHAIAFTVEMDHEMVSAAPSGSIVMESSRQYLRSGTMAVQAAQFLRRLGWPARAHIDGKYEVICPLVARDAGLGEIGRMGLLMTPRLGPRVRIAVITTDAPLLPDNTAHDESVLDFCTQCRKCADACPGRAVPDGPRIDADGLARWQIDSDACFMVWNRFGTDCGRCVSVCPYSHPDNLLHNLVRRGIRFSPILRRAAIVLDDLIYGRTPTPQPLPDWIPPRQ